MSSNWPTTWDTFVLTILNAISSSLMISNLSNRVHVAISDGKIIVFSPNVAVAEPSLVLILVFEGFVDTFNHGFAVEDEAFGDRRLHTTEY